ncbi:MAG: oxidoreductase, partial [Fermentimonas sp.]
MNRYTFVLILTLAAFISCNNANKESSNDVATFTGAPGEVELVVLAPGHFHASLLQNNNLPQVNDTVQVFAP